MSLPSPPGMLPTMPSDSLRLPSINPSRGQDLPKLPNIQQLLSSTSSASSPSSSSSSPHGRSPSSSPSSSGSRLPQFPSPSSLDFLPPKSVTSAQSTRPFDRNKRPRLDNADSPPRLDRSARLTGSSGPYEIARSDSRNSDPPGPRWQAPDPNPPAKPVFQYSTRPIVPIRVLPPPVTDSGPQREWLHYEGLRLDEHLEDEGASLKDSTPHQLYEGHLRSQIDDVE
ncbi:hypothetical protein FRB90_009299 [Tulasnella sp. 427]|nr:hypothetical protein FRB90_009299 [Tulasnella sp. 427]